MQRRDVLKKLGASTAVAVGATGMASARTLDEYDSDKVKYIFTEVDGERQRFTFEEFDEHSETPALSEATLELSTCDGPYNCCECCRECCEDVCACAEDCGSCDSC